MNRIIHILCLSVLALCFQGCRTCNPDYSYDPPLDLGDGLVIGTLQEVNLDTAIMAKLWKKIKCGEFNEVHSMLIYKKNLLVFEAYFEGHEYQWDAPDYHGSFVQWNQDTAHPIMSCTKSFISACIGIAIEKGFIANAQQSIFDYLPNYQNFKKDGKEHITIEHLLTMTSGLAWDEWGAPHGTSANDIDRIYSDCSTDPIKCVLEKELQSTPGEEFTYNGGGTIVLGEILKTASGMDVAEFSKNYLFRKLGIDSTSWYQFENGAFATDGSLNLRSRDMLKFGITYLNKGSWQGEKIVSEDWVIRSSKIYGNNKRINIPGEDSGRNGYGHSWWTSEFSHRGRQLKAFRAGGWGGQSIMVFPDLDMVIVFTGGNYATNSKLFKIVKKFVLPAAL